MNKKRQREELIIKYCKHCGVRMMIHADDIKHGWSIFCSDTCKDKDSENKNLEVS